MCFEVSQARIQDICRNEHLISKFISKEGSTKLFNQFVKTPKFRKYWYSFFFQNNNNI